jgi:hypothetical protein
MPGHHSFIRALLSLFVLLLFVNYLVTAENGYEKRNCHIALSLDDFMGRVAQSLGKTPDVSFS